MSFVQNTYAYNNVKVIKATLCLPLVRLKIGIFRKKPLGQVSGSGISEMFYQS